jgi:hypothetical protein
MLANITPQMHSALGEVACAVIDQKMYVKPTLLVC